MLLREFAEIIRRGDHTVLDGIADVASLVNTPCFGNGQYALHYSTLQNHIDMVRALVRLGANINARDINGFTAPYIASNAACYKDMLLFFASCRDVNFHCSPNHRISNVCRRGGYHGDDVKGAVSYCTHCDEDTRHICDMAESVHDRWCEPPNHTPSYLLPVRGLFEIKQRTATHRIICLHGVDTAVQLIPLLNHESLASMLAAAVRKGTLPVVRAAVEQGADVNVCEVGDYDSRPYLYLAMMRREYELAEYLIFHTNLDVHATDQYNRSPLDIAPLDVPLHIINELIRRRVTFKYSTLKRGSIDFPLQLFHAYARGAASTMRLTEDDRSDLYALRNISPSKRMVREAYISTPPYVCTMHQIVGDRKTNIEVLHDMLLRGSMPVSYTSCVYHCARNRPELAESCVYAAKLRHDQPVLHVGDKPCDMTQPIHESSLLVLACKPWTPSRHPYMYSSSFHVFVKSVMFAFALSVDALPYEMQMTIISYVSRQWFPVANIGATVVRSDDTRLVAWRKAHAIHC
jgi:ankyrin repeat protein